MGKAMIPHLPLTILSALGTCLTSRVMCNPPILRSSHEKNFCLCKHLWLIYITIFIISNILHTINP